MVPLHELLTERKEPVHVTGGLGDWHKAEKWSDTPAAQRVEFALEARMSTLIAKDVKTGGDFKEIDLLGRQLERLARIGKYERTGREADLNPAIEARNAGPKKRRAKNFLSDEQIEQLKSAFLDSLFKYQLGWWCPASWPPRCSAG